MGTVSRTFQMCFVHCDSITWRHILIYKPDDREIGNPCFWTNWLDKFVQGHDTNNIPFTRCKWTICIPTYTWSTIRLITDRNTSSSAPFCFFCHPKEKSSFAVKEQWLICNRSPQMIALCILHIALPRNLNPFPTEIKSLLYLSGEGTQIFTFLAPPWKKKETHPKSDPKNPFEEFSFFSASAISCRAFCSLSAIVAQGVDYNFPQQITNFLPGFSTIK